ncbi:hypothetical protein [Mycolicibacterium brisbanense]|uniref:Uncharacterized protein n=1 Tax=Mycolicibacterium brisbanense TaxID=146020 RepID=A0A100W2N2_9MYCO|nr:hypothetical protein [Mycolicibacterium brisbanense]MCV7158467.1 hypothetical protein [Mycolicibacterium brisbanense]GAS90481.1 uncharacterized protein RMCB_4577 [Mycolicibacterium brisbanense]
MAGNDSGLDTTPWRASRPNLGSTAPPTADLGTDWQPNASTSAFTAPPASTGAPGWRPTR